MHPLFRRRSHIQSGDEIPLLYPPDLPSIVCYSETPISGKSDGEVVTSWTDDSGNSHPIISSSEIGGTYETNEINGQSVLKHIWGKYSYISDHADLDVDNFTLFGVVRFDSYTHTDQVLCMKAHPSSWNNGYGIVLTGGMLYAFANAWNVGAVNYATPSAGTPFAFALRYNGSTVSVWIDGSNVASTAYSTSEPPS